MKTIVLLFVLFVALTAVTAARNKHKTKDGGNDEPGTDWPNAENVGEYGVPPEYGGPPPSDGGSSDPPTTPPGGSPPSRSHSRSNRHH